MVSFTKAIIHQLKDSSNFANDPEVDANVWNALSTAVVLRAATTLARHFKQRFCGNADETQDVEEPEVIVIYPILPDHRPPMDRDHAGPDDHASMPPPAPLLIRCRMAAATTPPPPAGSNVPPCVH